MSVQENGGPGMVEGIRRNLPWHSEAELSGSSRPLAQVELGNWQQDRPPALKGVCDPSLACKVSSHSTLPHLHMIHLVSG